MNKKLLLVFGTDTMGDCDMAVCDATVAGVIAACNEAMGIAAESVRKVRTGKEARELVEHFDEYDLHIDDDARRFIEDMP